jgi:uncharacterized protein DUF6843
VTGRRLLKRSLWGLAFVALLFLVLNYFYLGRAEPELYLIPADFKGPVVMVFGWEGGKPIEYEGGKRIYRIPPSGLFFTDNRGNSGHLLPGDRRFFYFGKDGRKSDIEEISDWQSELKKGRATPVVGAFAFRHGTATLTFGGVTGWCFFVEFIVGPLNEAQELLPQRDQLLHRLLKRS